MIVKLFYFDVKGRHILAFICVADGRRMTDLCVNVGFNITRTLMVESSEADTSFLSVGAMLMERQGSLCAGMTCRGSKKLSLRPFHNCE